MQQTPDNVWMLHILSKSFLFHFWIPESSGYFCSPENFEKNKHRKRHVFRSPQVFLGFRAALWTWATEAEASGASSKALKTSNSGRPRSASTVRLREKLGVFFRCFSLFTGNTKWKDIKRVTKLNIQKQSTYYSWLTYMTCYMLWYHVITYYIILYHIMSHHIL